MVALPVLLVLSLAASVVAILEVHGGGTPAAAPARSAAPSVTATATVAPTVRARPPVESASAPAASTSPPPAASTVPAAEVDARLAAVQQALTARASAFLRRDRAGWLAAIDPSAAAYRTTQAAVFANAAAVPFASYYYEVERADVASAGSPRPGQLLVPVTLRYALRGFDPQPTALRLYLTFAMHDDGWLLTGDADGHAQGLDSARDLWEFGPVVVARGVRSLVLAHPDKASLARTLAATADAAVPRVTAFWGNAWARTVVVVVPDSVGELRQVVGTKQDLSQIAALATAEIGTAPGSAGAVGDRIAINPATFGALGTLGRRVVMTHEITHVASRAVTGADSPTWLVEGLADYVGFKGTSTSTRFDAAELAHDIDAGRLPARLPTAHDFATAGSHLSLDYEEAWLACRFIVSRTDEATLIAFYKAVGTSSAPPAQALSDAFTDVLHTQQATFTRSWVSYVKASLK